jgi:hypothetical protein
MDPGDQPATVVWYSVGSVIIIPSCNPRVASTSRGFFLLAGN